MDEELITDFEIFENEKEPSSDEEDVESIDENEDELLIDESDDDDEAPEDITFHQGKEQALAQIQDVLSQIKGEKRRDKLKKRHLHEKYTEQKKDKLDALAKRKLPDDFLEDLSEKPVVKSKKKVKQPKAIEEDFNDEDIDALIEDLDDEKNEDFIPLTKDEPVKPMELKKVQKVSAEDFKMKMMYGKHIERVPTATMIREKSKRQYLLRNAKKPKNSPVRLVTDIRKNAVKSIAKRSSKKGRKKPRGKSLT
ncbi:uncharacterized protein LOC141908636 [Tubulanus polymorphus]|uniref:uncharacterized protein LOC141908636 n=1 Tax=Tubulanus polymorphus TaxID=672921 RepID=UPI003DA60405